VTVFLLPPLLFAHFLFGSAVGEFFAPIWLDVNFRFFFHFVSECLSLQGEGGYVQLVWRSFLIIFSGAP